MSEKQTPYSQADTEKLILRAAEREFIDKGFESARTTTIAEDAGVTHAMLHYYFRTKEKLFDTVLSTKVSEMRRVMLGFIDNEELPLLRRIELGVRRHFEFLMNNPQLPLFIINELRRKDSKVAKFMEISKDTANDIQASLQSAIDAAASKGECRRMDARTLMLDIISLNVAPFVGAPLIDCIFAIGPEKRHEFLPERLEENVKTILNKLQP